MSVKHETTCTDEQVRGYRGTIARCTCGWSDAWALQGGNAEASAAKHMRENDPEYAAAEQARWEAGAPARAEQQRLYEEREAARKSEPPSVPREPCHSCRCFISPPCNACVACTHIDYPDCPNDCQECEIPHEY